MGPHDTMWLMELLRKEDMMIRITWKNYCGMRVNRIIFVTIKTKLKTADQSAIRRLDQEV